MAHQTIAQDSSPKQSQSFSPVDNGERVLQIIANALHYQMADIPKSHSFFELGGDSISMVSALVMLREQDLYISMQEFDSAKSIQEVIDHVIPMCSSVKLPEPAASHQYTTKKLQDVDEKETIMQLFVESFVAKEPLLHMLNVTAEEFMPSAEWTYDNAKKSKESFLAFDTVTGNIVGGVFLFDYFMPMNATYHQKARPAFALVDELELPTKEKFRKNPPGDLLYCYCLFVRKDVADNEQVMICHLLETEVTEVARQGGYKGIVASNTNPVTQNICKHFHGYEVLAKYLVRRYEFNGKKVFGNAPKDYHIELAMKHL